MRIFHIDCLVFSYFGRKIWIVLLNYSIKLALNYVFYCISLFYDFFLSQFIILGGLICNILKAYHFLFYLSIAQVSVSGHFIEVKSVGEYS